MIRTCSAWKEKEVIHTRIAAWSDLAISLSCSNLGLLPKISGSQKVPTAPFMCPILPWAGAGAFTHCDGSRPTPHTMYAWVNVFGLRAPCLTFNVEGSGWVMRECNDDVRLGIKMLWSVLLSLVGGRSSRVRGRRVRDGAIVGELRRWYRIDRATSPWVTSGGSKTRWYYDRDRGNIRRY